jgi:hypothetical protein
LRVEREEAGKAKEEAKEQETDDPDHRAFRA